VLGALHDLNRYCPSLFQGRFCCASVLSSGLEPPKNLAVVTAIPRFKSVPTIELSNRSIKNLVRIQVIRDSSLRRGCIWSAGLRDWSRSKLGDEVQEQPGVRPR